MHCIAGRWRYLDVRLVDRDSARPKLQASGSVAGVGGGAEDLALMDLGEPNVIDRSVRVDFLAGLGPALLAAVLAAAASFLAPVLATLFVLVPVGVLLQYSLVNSIVVEFRPAKGDAVVLAMNRDEWIAVTLSRRGYPP
jgi:hypothetical protein